MLTGDCSEVQLIAMAIDNMLCFPDRGPAEDARWLTEDPEIALDWSHLDLLEQLEGML